MNAHDSLKQFHEKEKSRKLFLEATRSGGSVTEHWRQILIVLVFIAAIGGTFASRTQRFRDVLDTLNQDPLKDKRATMRRAVPRPGADPDKYLEEAHSAWADQEFRDSSKNEDPDDMTEELTRTRKSREALGAQLEAVGEGRALPPSPASVTAALEGRTTPPPRQAEPKAEPEPLPATLLTQPASTREPSSPAKAEQVPAPVIYPASTSAVYQPVKQIPGPYAQEKQEFPDIP